MTLEFRLSISKTTRLMTAAVVFLFAAGITVDAFKYFLHNDWIYGLTRLFNLDTEANVPSFYQAATLLLSSFILFCLARADRARGVGLASSWFHLSGIFLLLAFDEWLSFHELLIGPMRLRFHLTGIFYFAWVIPALFFMGLVGIRFYRFIFSLPSSTRWRVFLAAFVFLSGALGMEMVGGVYVSEHGMKNWNYVLLCNFEELLEMIGIILWVRALGHYAKSIPAWGHGLKIELAA